MASWGSLVEAAATLGMEGVVAFACAQALRTLVLALFVLAVSRRQSRRTTLGEAVQALNRLLGRG